MSKNEESVTKAEGDFQITGVMSSVQISERSHGCLIRRFLGDFVKSDFQDSRGNGPLIPQ